MFASRPRPSRAVAASIKSSRSAPVHSNASVVTVNTTRSEPLPARKQHSLDINVPPTRSKTCVGCENHHVQTLEGRYIHANFLDRYMSLKYTSCGEFKRTSKLDKHVVTVPELLHEGEILYLQKATSRGRLVENYLVPPLQKSNTM